MTAIDLATLPPADAALVREWQNEVLHIRIDPIPPSEESSDGPMTARFRAVITNYLNFVEDVISIEIGIYMLTERFLVELATHGSQAMRHRFTDFRPPALPEGVVQIQTAVGTFIPANLRNLPPRSAVPQFHYLRLCLSQLHSAFSSAVTIGLLPTGPGRRELVYATAGDLMLMPMLAQVAEENAKTYITSVLSQGRSAGMAARGAMPQDSAMLEALKAAWAAEATVDESDDYIPDDELDEIIAEIQRDEEGPFDDEDR
jgi:hypothetical protein